MCVWVEKVIKSCGFKPIFVDAVKLYCIITSLLKMWRIFYGAICADNTLKYCTSYYLLLLLPIYLQEIIIINITLNDERLFFIIVLHSSGQQSSTRKEMSHIIFPCINIQIASEGFFVLPPTHPSIHRNVNEYCWLIKFNTIPSITRDEISSGAIIPLPQPKEIAKNGKKGLGVKDGKVDGTRFESTR